MTPELRQFLTEWLQWAEDGAPEHPSFDAKFGLCHNAEYFGALTSSRLSIDLEDEIFHLLGGRGSSPYPFGVEEYHQARIRSTQHLNPKRLTWVREQLETPE